MAKGGFYAVAKGRNPGIYTTWDECEKQVKGFTSARYKKFSTKEEAQKFINDNKGVFENLRSSKSPKQLPKVKNDENMANNFEQQHFMSKNKTNIAKRYFYAVKKGKNPGVYSTWPECEEQVKDYHYAQYKKFPTMNEALKFITQSKWFYAVKNGRNPGIFIQWLECEKQIKDFPNPQFRKFSSIDEALQFINYDDTKNFTFKITTQKTAADIHPQTNYATKRYLEEADDNELPTKRFKETIDIENDENLKIDIQPEIQSQLRYDNKNKLIHLYTDGACIENGKFRAKAGIGVFWGRNHCLNTSKKLWGRPTNNRAEIHAAGLALRQAKAYGYKNIVLHTDSKFMINSITKWINKWESNDWTLINGGQVINKEDFLVLKESMKDLNVKWKYCPGHRGIYGNEAADKLAKAAIRM